MYLCRDLARTQQKGGGGLVHQIIFDIPCIPHETKLTKGGGLNKEGWGHATTF